MVVSWDGLLFKNGGAIDRFDRLLLDGDRLLAAEQRLGTIPILGIPHVDAPAVDGAPALDQQVDGLAALVLAAVRSFFAITYPRTDVDGVRR